MNAQQLKNSVLQMAVQGKLVSQDPNAEPANGLLEKIKAEKAELVKQKKIKADKNPSTIFRGEDNLFYEIVGTETKCIHNQIPFDIPDSWEWVRLGEIGQYRKGPFGSSLTKNIFVPRTETTVKVYEQKNAIQKDWTLGNYFINYDYYQSKMKSFTVVPQDIIVSCAGTIGETYILPDNAELGIINQALMRIRLYNNINKNFFLIYFDYMLKKEAKIVSKGSAIKNIPPFEKFKFMLFPLPPLEEQKRIVEKVQSLQPLIAQYAEADTALQNLEKSFPENLKKSLLQWAVQGKLVPQDPNAEPAKALLEKIKAEKTELAQKELNGQKKIKADKTPSIIFRGEDNLFYETVGTETKCIQDEIPFDIPDSWEWVRLGEIVYNHGQKTPDAQFSYIDIGSIDNINQKLNEQENILLPEKAPSRARKIVNKGDILYATVRPYLHNMCIIDKDFTYEPIASTGFAVLTCYKNIYNKFLFYYLLSPTFDSYANHNENSKGVAYPAINDTKLYKGLIPLPPLEEQKRITQKLETLKTLCTELERE